MSHTEKTDSKKIFPPERNIIKMSKVILKEESVPKITLFIKLCIKGKIHVQFWL